MSTGSNPWITGRGGWRPLNGRPGLRMAVSHRSQSVGCGRRLSLRLIGYTPALSLTFAVRVLWRYISVMTLPLRFTIV